MISNRNKDSVDCSQLDLQDSTEPIRSNIHHCGSIIYVRQYFSRVTATARNGSVPCVSSRTWLDWTTRAKSIALTGQGCNER
jgi:hypothetical protein